MPSSPASGARRALILRSIIGGSRLPSHPPQDLEGVRKHVSEVIAETFRGDGEESIPSWSQAEGRPQAGGRWLLVVADEGGAEPSGATIAAQLKPLVRHRGGEVRRLPADVLYDASGRLKSDSEQLSGIDEWAQALLDDVGDKASILLAGSPAELPFTLYQRLALNHNVGYLSLPEAQDYGAYANKVVAAERKHLEGRSGSGAGAPPQGRLITFGTDFDSPGILGQEVILKHAVDLANETGRQTRRLVGRKALEWRLADELAAAPAGSLVITCCHGQDNAQGDFSDPLQGALLDFDIRPLKPETVRRGSALRDGVAILYACNSGGVPRQRRWARLIDNDVQCPETDVVAATPSALLANPDGPLAVIAHADNLLTWGICDPDLPPDSQLVSGHLKALRRMFARVMGGETVGEAWSTFRPVIINSLFALMDCVATPGGRDNDLVVRWCTWADAVGWMVLGDPEARLGGYGPAPAGTRAPGHELATAGPASPERPPETGPGEIDPAPVDVQARPQDPVPSPADDERPTGSTAPTADGAPPPVDEGEVFRDGGPPSTGGAVTRDGDSADAGALLQPAPLAEGLPSEERASTSALPGARPTPVEAPSPAAYRPPAAAHVVWHPSSQVGAAIAREVYSAVCRPADRAMDPGPGVPVSFHGSFDQDPPPWRPDALSQGSVTVVILDGAALRDDRWQSWAATLSLAPSQVGAAQGEHRVIYLTLPGIRVPWGAPIPNHMLRKVSGTAPERAPQGEANDGGSQAGAGDPIPQEVALIVSHALCELLISMGGGAQDRRNPTIQLSRPSSAGDDALLSALSGCLATLARVGVKLDLEAGDPDQPLDPEAQLSIESLSTVLVAVQSDDFASQTRCRWEVLRAKEYGLPILVINVLDQGEERAFPYLGNVPTLRVSPETLEGDAAAWRMIVSRALSIALKGLFFRLDVDALLEAWELPRAPVKLLRPPEALTCARVDITSARRSSLPAGSTFGAPGQRSGLVIYPDPALDTEELSLLRSLGSRRRFVTPMYLPSYRLEAPVADLGRGRLQPRGPLLHAVIGLSLSAAGPADPQRHRDPGAFSQTTDPGLGALEGLHLTDLVLGLARALLAAGATLAYGGDLRPISQGGYTEYLTDLVRRHNESGTHPFERLRNYLGFPDHRRAPPAALDFRLADCQTLPTPCPADVDVELAGSNDRVSLEARFAKARCYTQLRLSMGADLSARVVMGGKIYGSQGRMPGILEEAMLALAHGQPVFLIGGFGGCAAEVARALAQADPERWGADGAPPRGLSVSEHQAAVGESFTSLMSRYAMHTFADPSGEPLRETGAIPEEGGPGVGPGADLDGASRWLGRRGAVGPARCLDNGLSDEENRRLLWSQHIPEIIGLISRGLRKLAGRGKLARPGRAETEDQDELAAGRHLLVQATQGDGERQRVDVLVVGVWQHAGPMAGSLRRGGEVAGLLEDLRHRRLFWGAQGQSQLIDVEWGELAPDLVQFYGLGPMPTPSAPLAEGERPPYAQAARDTLAGAIIPLLERGASRLAFPLPAANDPLDIETATTISLEAMAEAASACDVSSGGWSATLLARTDEEVERALDATEKVAGVLQAGGWRLSPERGPSPSPRAVPPAPEPAAPHIDLLITVDDQRRDLCLTLIQGERGASVTPLLQSFDLTTIGDVLRDLDSRARREQGGSTPWQRLTDLLIPREIQEALTASTAGEGSAPPAVLQLILDERIDWLPWEALQLGGVSLGERAAVIRLRVAGASRPARPLGTSSWQARQRDPQLRIALIRPDTGSGPALPSALVERDQILQALRSAGDGGPDALIEIIDGADCTRARIARILSGGTHDVIHFMGHAYFSDPRTKRSGLLCSDGLLTADDLTRGLGDAPMLVFLNACQSIRTGSPEELKQPSVVNTLLDAGVGALVGTWWKIEDQAAGLFSHAVYRGLARGDTLAEAILQGRRELRANGQAPAEAGARSYVVYGRPELRLKPPRQD